MIARLRRIGGRFAVMLSGEVLQSAFSFALNIALARILPAKSYGEFAIVVMIGGLAIIYIRSLVGVPICTFIPQSRSARRAGAYGVTFGSGALALSTIGGVVGAATLSIWQPDSALAGGLFIGAWSLRSYVRMAMFAVRHATKATLGDLVFTLCATAFSLPLMLNGGAALSLQNIFLALAAAHVIGVAVALGMLGQPVRISFRRSVRIRFRKLLPTLSWSIVSVTMASIQSQGPTLLIAALAGPAAYAPIAATLAFFSPLRMAASALANMTQPDLAAEVSGHQRHRARGRLLTQSGVIAAICLAYGLFMAAAFPLLTRHLFAGRFEGAPLLSIAVLIWAIAAVAVLYSVPKTLLEAVLDFRGLTLISGWAALVGLPLAAVLVTVLSPAAALAGLFVSEAMILAGCWIAASRAIGHTPPASARAAAEPIRATTTWRGCNAAAASLHPLGPGL